MMKKLLLVLAPFAAFAFAACGDPADLDEVGQVDQASTETVLIQPETMGTMAKILTPEQIAGESH